LLPERADETTDYFRLPIQVDEPLFERAREPHEIIKLELLRSREFAALTRLRQPGRLGRGCAGPRHSVRRFDAVSRIARFVKCDKKLLGVAVEPTVTGLVSRSCRE